MFKKVLFLLLFIIISGFFLFPEKSLAATTGGIVPCGHGSSVSDACNLCYLIKGILNIVEWGLLVLVSVALTGIFFAGVIYIISAGDPGLMGKAKKFLSYSLTGFAVVLLAWLIVNVTLWIFSFDTNMKTVIGKDNWYTFSVDCNSSSSDNEPVNGACGNPSATEAKSKKNICSAGTASFSFGPVFICNSQGTTILYNVTCKGTNGGSDSSVCSKTITDEETCENECLLSGSTCGGSNSGSCCNGSCSGTNGAAGTCP